MSRETTESRVDSLEIRMTQLEQLPARIDNLASQVVQLRTEMRSEFSTVRGEIAEQGKTLRGEIAEQGKALSAKIDDQGTQMRVLHEEVIGRIALLQEGWSTPSRKPRKK